MKSRLIFIIIIISIAAIPAFSQIYKGQGKMRGTVVDEEGKPIADVKVKLFSLKANAGFEKKTNKNGEWKAFFIRGGHWHLDFLKQGYEPKRMTSPNVREVGGKMIEVNIVLKKMQGPAVTEDLLKEYENGMKLYDQKDYKGALAIFNTVLAKSPDTYVIHLSAGNCYMQMGDFDKAIESYKKVIEKDPKHIDAIIAVGNCYGNKNDSKNAMIWYNKIDETKIKDPVVLYNIGVYNFNANNSKGAVKFFKLAVETDTQYLDAYYQLGLSYLGLGKMKEAIATFKKYLEIDKDSQKAAEVRGIIKDLGGTVK